MNFHLGYSKTCCFAGKLFRAMLVLAVAAIVVVPAYSQDDDEAVPGKVVDASNKTVGRADLTLDIGQPPTNFGYWVYLYVGTDRLMVIKPQSGSRSSTIVCSFREYKIDVAKPKDRSKWIETGSGTATLQMPATGEVSKINVTVTLTKKVVGDNDVAVNEKAQKLVIVLD